LWGFVRHQLYCPAEVYCGAGDAGIVTPAGQPTHGRDRCCASLYGQPVPGLAVCTRSLVSVQQRRACPLRLAPVVRRDAENAASKAPAAAQKPTGAQAPRRPGRPQGRQHSPTAAAPRTSALVRITGMLTALLPLFAPVLAVPSLGLEGHCGTHNALQMARQGGLPLMATLR